MRSSFVLSLVFASALVSALPTSFPSVPIADNPSLGSPIVVGVSGIIDGVPTTGAHPVVSTASPLLAQRASSIDGLPVAFETIVKSATPKRRLDLESPLGDNQRGQQRRGLTLLGSDSIVGKTGGRDEHGTQRNAQPIVVDALASLRQGTWKRDDGALIETQEMNGKQYEGAQELTDEDDEPYWY
ncbi:hypothetical protein P7C73_g2721, partial [Tremellales sp. Uapishka_1]